MGTKERDIAYIKSFGERESLSKSEKTKIKIIRSSIPFFYKKGPDKTSFTALAQSTGITRQLIQHYFQDIRSLFYECHRYIKWQYQQVGQESRKGKNQKQVFTNYIQSIFNFSLANPHYMSLSHLHNYYATIDKESFAHNNEIVQESRDRIVELIEDNFNKQKELNQAIYVIQTLIFGGVDYPHVFEVEGGASSYHKALLKAAVAAAGFK